MKNPFSRFLLVLSAVVIVSSLALPPLADAGPRGGGGGGRGGGGGAGAGGAGAGGAGGGARQAPQASNSKADARTSDVRGGSVNNINSSREVNVNVDVDQGCCGGWDHPVAAAAVVTGAVAVTAAAVGSVVATVPASCVPVNHGGVVYQQCGSTWYQAQGAEFVVVNPPQ